MNIVYVSSNICFQWFMGNGKYDALIMVAKLNIKKIGSKNVVK